MRPIANLLGAPMNQTRSLVILLGAALTLSACASKRKSVSDLPPTPPAASAGIVTGDAGETGQPGDAGVGTAGVPGSQEDLTAQTGADHVLFDTDASELDNEARTILTAHARWFIANPSVRATIEGHCDERGTREYNLALGERRANAAKNYLAAQGVDVRRLSVVSYGKERPAVDRSDESAWADNRRAVTVVVSR